MQDPPDVDVRLSLDVENEGTYIAEYQRSGGFDDSGELSTTGGHYCGVGANISSSLSAIWRSLSLLAI